MPKKPEVNKGDIVLFHHDRGWTPAIVTSVCEISKEERKKGKEEPDIACVVFLTGFHLGCEPIARVEYGTKSRQYVRQEEEPIHIPPTVPTVPVIREEDE